MMDGELFADEEYRRFVDKFKPKKTTDDCYTPPEVYNVVRDYACERWNIAPATIVRPFYPGGDYQRFNYPDRCIVIDNPPFSIYSEIVRWYAVRGIKFFLFAPALTLFSPGLIHGVTYLVAAAQIIYENGADVNTSFAHNLGDGEIALEGCPELHDRIKEAVATLQKQKKKQVRKLSYPVEIITAARVNWLTIHHAPLAIRRADCAFVRRLDNDSGGIFGGGLLLSERAAAERAAAERAAAVRAAAERIPLSDRERQIVMMLGGSRLAK